MNAQDQLNDGGPAFPTPSGHATIKGYQPGVGEYEQTVDVCKIGMSLRDWFAGMVMAGLMANPIDKTGLNCVETAYEAADAMLAARQKGKQS